MLNFARIYLIPGAVLQSVMIGGGYGTGREVVEYFTHYGTLGGVYAILVATLSIAVVFSMSLELARVYKVYDYRNFFKVLLGRFWFLYEILGVMLFMLVIAVIGSAAGQILRTELGIPAYMGSILMLIAVVLLTFYGRALIVLVLAYWSIFLYVVFAIYLLAVFVFFGSELSHAEATVTDGWFISGMQYSFYNITAAPIILYSARAIKTRRQALLAGIAGAMIAIVPALMLHVSFVTQFPMILSAELPVYEIFTLLDMDWLKLVYLVVLFGTFIETGAGNIQGFIERLDGWWMEKTGRVLARPVHALIAGLLVALAGTLAQVGIVSLIADGYGTLAWGFMIIYILPLLTVGVWRLVRPLPAADR